MPDEHGGARAEGCDARRLLLKERQVKACMRAMGWGGVKSVWALGKTEVGLLVYEPKFCYESQASTAHRSVSHVTGRGDGFSL